MDDKKIILNPSLVGKNAFVKILFVNKQIIKQKGQLDSVRVYEIIERLNKSYDGFFQIELSLKNLICQILAINNIQTDYKDEDQLRNLYYGIINQIQSINFIYEVDQQLRIDKCETIVRARDFLGVVAASALGNFKNVNHINIEEEVKIMLKPLADLIEKKKRNKVFKSFKI